MEKQREKKNRWANFGRFRKRQTKQQRDIARGRRHGHGRRMRGHTSGSKNQPRWTKKKKKKVKKPLVRVATKK